MTYATKQDLIDRFGELELKQLTDRVNRPPTTIDVVVVDRALGDAAALIDGYLAKVYELPVVSTPPVLVKNAADIARYYLHGKAAEKDSPVTRAYNEAVAWLRDVSKGVVRLDLGDGSGTEPAAAGGGAIRANPSSRVFRRDTLRGL